MTGIARSEAEPEKTIIVGNFYEDKGYDQKNNLVDPYCRKKSYNCLAFIVTKVGDDLTRELIPKAENLIIPQGIHSKGLRGVFPEVTAVSKDGTTVVGWMLTKEPKENSATAGLSDEEKTYGIPFDKYHTFSYNIEKKKGLS